MRLAELSGIRLPEKKYTSEDMDRIEQQNKKTEMLEISKEFNDNEEQRFRKMLQQGGKIKIQGNHYEIRKLETQIRNSKGEYDSPIKLKKPEDWE